MSNNYDDYGYEDKDYDNSGAAKKRLFIGFLVVAAIIIVIILFLKGCAGGNKKPNNSVTPAFDYEKTLLEAGKKFYENNTELAPVAKGECSTVELSTLVSKGLINPENFTTCDNSETYVRVCVLPNGTKQYTPWLKCTDKDSNSEYGDEKEGTISDVKADESLVRFTFMPMRLKAGSQNLGPVEEVWKEDVKYTSYKTLATTKYYRYRDQLFTWKIQDKTYYTSTGEKKNAKDVKEYYTVAPNSNYNLHDNKTDNAYKWYTITGGSKVWAMDKNGNKIPSKDPIKDYNVPGETLVVNRQTRKVTGTREAYHYYVCGKYSTSTDKLYSLNDKCGTGSNANRPYTFEEFYTCGYGDVVDIEAGRVKKGEKCSTYSEWKETFEQCNTSLPTCRAITPVYYYYWYKLTGGTKKYYPSGSTSASGEKIYYVDAPTKDAVKDLNTKATAYKWYKATESETSEYTAVAPKNYPDATKTSKSKWSDWSSWTSKNPKTSDGRTRQIETKTKIKLQEIKGTNESSWEKLSQTYVSEEEMITIYKNNKYNVNSLQDINNNGELKYDIKMIIRNKKEASR